MTKLGRRSVDERDLLLRTIEQLLHRHAGHVPAGRIVRLVHLTAAELLAPGAADELGTTRLFRSCHGRLVEEQVPRVGAAA
ncbi:MAG TPA: hypothetical protein VFG63_04800 [Nocardioidaceae bacterium]|nr:hypothetical protein [Nocardioidaceae bacterium]